MRVKADAEGSSGWGHFQVLAKHAVLGAFGVVAKKQAVHSTTRAAVAIIIKLLQMVSFVVASHAGLTWSSTIAPLRTVSGLTTVSGYLDWVSSGVYLAFYYLSLVYVAVFVSLFGWALTCFVRNEWPVLWPLKALRAMGGLSATTLFIPLLYLLMSGFNCGDGEFVSEFWVGYACFSGGHLAQVALSALLIAAFVTLAGLFTLLVFDSHPLSPSPLAKAHGRADVVFLACKVVLVAVVDVWPLVLGRWVVCAVIVLSGVLWAAAHVALLPMYHHAMNRFQIAVTFVYTWAALSLVLSMAYPGYDAAVALYLGAPLAALAGVAAADLRAGRIFRAPPASLLTQYEVEIQARLALHDLLWGHPTAEVGDLAQRVAALEGDAAVQGARARFLTGADGEEAAVSASAAGSSSQGLATPQARGAAATPAAEALDDSDVQAQLARRILSPEDLAAAEALYAAGCARFRQHPMLHVFAARFYHVFAQNKHLQMSHLLRAARQQPALDVSFLIFLAHQEAEAAASSSSLSALSRISFEKHLGDARKHVLLAMRAQVAFWAALQKPVPSLSDMRTVCAGMTASIGAAETAFVELLAISAESLVVLRLYGEFCMFLTNDVPKAEFLLAEADRIEEQRNKEQQRESGSVVRIMELSKLDIMADTAAVVIADGSASNLGVITSVNAAAVKLFGHSRWQLEHRNLSTLMPSPFAELHDGFMRRYLVSGTSTLVDYTRVLFGLHRNGTIFTILLAVREAAAGDGSISVVGMMRPLVTTEHHILLDAEHRVMAATLESCALLGAQPAALTANKPLIEEWIAEWRAVLGDLERDTGSMLFVRWPQDDEDAAAAQYAGGGAGLWIQGHLQILRMPGGHVAYVLHWHRMSSDAYTVGRAEQRRRSSLSSAGAYTPGLVGGRRSGRDAAASVDATLAEADLPAAEPGPAGMPPPQLGSSATLLLQAGGRRRSSSPLGRTALTAAGATLPDSMGASVPRALTSGFTPSKRRLSTSTRGSAVGLGPLSSVTTRDVSFKLAAAGRSTHGVGGAGDDRSSAASSVATGGRLHRRVRDVLRDEASHATLLPGLQVLRAVGIFISILAAAMAVAMTAYVYVALGLVATTLGNAADASSAIDALGGITLELRALVDCSLNWAPCPRAREEALRAELLAYARDFGVLHQGLSAAAGAAGLRDAYDAAAVPIVSYNLDTKTSALIATPSFGALFSAGLALGTAAEDAAAMPLENLTSASPAVAFALNNSFPGLSVHGALNATLARWLAAGKTSSAASLAGLTAMFGAMVAVVASLALCVVTPVLASVDRARDQFLLPFLDIPDELTAHLRVHAQRRLRVIEGAEEAADGGDDGDGALSVHSEDGVGEDAEAAVLVGGECGRQQPADVDDEGNIDWSALAQRLARRRGGRSGCGGGSLNEAKRYRRAWGPLLALGARFVLPLLCLIPAFAAIYATSAGVMGEVGALAETSLAAELLAGEVTQVFIVVEGTIRGGVSTPPGAAASPDAAWLSKDCAAALLSLEYHRRLLFFGAPTASFAAASGAVTSGRGAIEAGAFVDGCTFLGALGQWGVEASLGMQPPTFDDAACRAFGHGIVARGLSGSIDALLVEARALCEARGTVLITDPAGGLGAAAVSGLGYSIPSVLAGTSLGAVRNLTRAFLTPAFNGLAVSYEAATYAHIAAQQAFLVAFTCGALGAFAAFMVLAYLPAIGRVNAETARQRMLLLIVPAPLLLHVGGISEACTALLAGSASAATGSRR